MDLKTTDTRHFGHGSFTPEEAIYLQDTLQKQLGPEWISNRNGQGASTLSYVQGHNCINLANKIFGFNGWSSEIKSLTTDYLEVNAEGNYNVCVSVIMRITVKDGTFHEDIGVGTSEKCKSKIQAIVKAKKAAATDATKRVLRNFGAVMGNCLYDKYYTQQIKRVGLPPKRFDTNDLFRENAPPPPFMNPARSMVSHPNPSTIPPVNNCDLNVQNRQQAPILQSTSSGSSSSLRQPRPTTSASVNQPTTASAGTVEVKGEHQEDVFIVKREHQEDSFISYDDDPSLYAQIDEEAFDYFGSEDETENGDELTR